MDSATWNELINERVLPRATDTLAGLQEIRIYFLARFSLLQIQWQLQASECTVITVKSTFHTMGYPVF